MESFQSTRNRGVVLRSTLAFPSIRAAILLGRQGRNRRPPKCSQRLLPGNKRASAGAEGNYLLRVAFGDSCISNSNESITRNSPTDKLLSPKNGVHSRQ